MSATASSNVNANENSLGGGEFRDLNDINNIIANLVKSSCIREGNYKLKSGKRSKYYFNMKNLISNPVLLKQMSEKLYQKLADFDIICGIPHGGLPIATYISLKYNKPMIYMRDSAKKYGTENLIEGTYNSNSRCVIIDDVFTSGNSIRQAINVLKDKVKIVDIGVLMNRQESTEYLNGWIDDWHVKSLLYKNDYIKYRLGAISNIKRNNICFAADIEDPVKLLDILNRVGSYISICKIHYDIINVESYERICGGEKASFVEDLIALSIQHDFLIMEDRKFMDISYITRKQYSQFSGWVDLVTVHSLVTDEVLSGFSGALIVANMSNNNYDFYEKAGDLAKNNSINVVGFISQHRIKSDGLVCMTPGVKNTGSNNRVDDQRYRSADNIDTDYIIVGRDIYQSEDPVRSIQKYISYNM